MSAAEIAKSAAYTVDGSGLHAIVRDPDGRIVCIRHRMSGADNEYFMRWIADALTVQEETSKNPRQLADEVERLRESWDSCIDTADSLRQTVGELKRESGDLRGEVERLRADAARFRVYFGGEEYNCNRDAILALHMDALSGSMPTLDQWRVAIDAVIAEQQQTTGGDS